MKQSYEREEAERLVPLLRSIGREVRARQSELARIEDRMSALRPTRHVHGDELARLESERSTHCRALRHAEEELARLGCRLDEGEAVRILVPADRSEHQIDGFLGQTCFRPA
jgi:hypothetical protein